MDNSNAMHHWLFSDNWYFHSVKKNTEIDLIKFTLASTL